MGRNRSALCALVLASMLASKPTLAGDKAGPTPGRPVAPETAADLARQALAEYTAGNFEAAAALYERVYQLEPKTNTLFALAQSERLSNQCDKAVPHYKALLDAATDIEQGKLVERAMSLCPTAAVFVPAPLPPPPPPPPAPALVARDVPPTNTNSWLLAGGGIALGAGVALLLASHSDRDDADAARSFADHERISTRADRLQIAGIVGAVAGAGLAGYAIYRIKFRGESRSTDLAVTPSTAGGSVTLSGSW